MGSLSAHLRRTEGHAALPFHPDCPVCRRERLAGTLPADGLISPRTQAAVAAGVLAFSAGGAVPVAVAAEPDQTTTGAAVPPPVSGGATQSPDFDPGGETTYMPDAPAEPQVPAPAVPDNDDVGPLDQEPVTDVAPVAPEEVTSTPPPVAAQPTPSPALPDATVGEEPSATPSPKPEDGAADPNEAEEPAAGAEEPSTDAPDGDGDKSHKGHRGPRTTHRTTDSVAVEAPVRSPVTTTVPTAPAAPAAPSPSVQTAPVEPASTTVTTQYAATTASAPVKVTKAGGRAKPGDRTHVVRAGESLWTIAADHLGGRASVAKIAREVNRLWTLNEDRIATGDPNLLRVGTQLRLR
jgi:hypothetical protein